MSACLCPRCTDDPAPTYTEKHRHACEVAWVARLPDKAARGRYLRDVAEERGKAAREAIIDGLRGMM